MNSEQIVYTNTSAPLATSGVLPSTTAHSYTVHHREERHLDKERAKESKRAVRQEKSADKLAVKAEKHFGKAASKAQSGGFLSERSAMRHEEKAVKLAAASNLHRQAAAESFSEANRASVLSSLPPRGTLPATAQSSAPLGGSTFI